MTRMQGGESGKWTDGAGMTTNNGIDQRLDGDEIECVRSADWCFMEPLYLRTAPYFNSIGAFHLLKGGDRQRSLSDGVRGNVNGNVTTALSWLPTAIPEEARSLSSFAPANPLRHVAPTLHRGGLSSEPCKVP